MKKLFKRAGVIILSLSFVFAMNIKGTYGLESSEPEVQADTDIPDSSVTLDNSGTSNNPEPPDNSGTPNNPVTPDNSGTPNNPVTPDNSGTSNNPVTPDNSGTPNNPETPDNSVPPDNTETPDDSETPDNSVPPDNPEIPDNSESPDKPEPPDNSVTPDNPGTSDNPGTPDSDNSEIPNTPAEPEVPELPENSLVPEDTQSTVVRNAETYSFMPSGVFLDNREKSKYSVEVPIEGIPSFITPEMVVAALKCQDETGYPASVTIAQIIQESGFGNYGPGGDQGQGLSYLAYQYNNLFGIKGSGPAGSAVMATGEQTESGEAYMTSAGFRAYNTYTECIEDRTQLLKEVYSDLTFGVSDANTFAAKIGRRWATDINYSKHLIQQMEKYDLYRLDVLTLEQFNDMFGSFINPCPGAVLTSPYGYREFRNSNHKGIDLGTGASNIPTYAAEQGTVIFAGWDDSAGNFIIIDHGNGLVTKYMHHDKLYVKEGQKVEKGQQIGLSGTTGDSTGNHLHFQVEKNGVAEDPMTYLQKSDAQ